MRRNQLITLLCLIQTFSLLAQSAFSDPCSELFYESKKVDACRELFENATDNSGIIKACELHFKALYSQIETNLPCYSELRESKFIREEVGKIEISTDKMRYADFGFMNKGIIYVAIEEKVTLDFLSLVILRLCYIGAENPKSVLRYDKQKLKSTAADALRDNSINTYKNVTWTVSKEYKKRKAEAIKLNCLALDNDLFYVEDYKLRNSLGCY